MIPQPPTEPVDLTPSELAALPVVCYTVQTLDQVAAMVAVHDGASRAEIALEGTGFRVTLGPRRPLVYEFSEKDKRKLSETKRARLLAKLDRDLFVSARDWAVRELRALPKGMRRKVHPPRKVAPSAGEADQLRRQLEEARGALSVARKGWGAEKEQREELGKRVEILEENLSCARDDHRATSEELDRVQAELASVLERTLPEVDNLSDQLTVDFFRANFRDIPLAALEWVVEENRRA